MDIQNYNPFGRGGGGAPIKDDAGNAIGNYVHSLEDTKKCDSKISLI